GETRGGARSQARSRGSAPDRDRGACLLHRARDAPAEPGQRLPPFVAGGGPASPDCGPASKLGGTLAAAEGWVTTSGNRGGASPHSASPRLGGKVRSSRATRHEGQAP